jgi:hypothetical protein
MNRIPTQLGEQPTDHLSSTTATTVTSGYQWFAIQGMWSNTVFATLTDLSRSGTLGTVALVANAIIYGAFTNLTLTSGAVRLYRTRIS